MTLDDLKTVAEWDRTRPRAQPKGKSRLELKANAKPLTVVTEAQFRRIVRDRDKLRCRRCGRKTVVTVEKIQRRCEVHHLHGRIGPLRFEDRCAIVTCGACHELLTGRVNERWIVVGTKFVTIEGQERIDARAKVAFVKVTA